MQEYCCNCDVFSQNCENIVNNLSEQTCKEYSENSVIEPYFLYYFAIYLLLKNGIMWRICQYCDFFIKICVFFVWTVDGFIRSGYNGNVLGHRNGNIQETETERTVIYMNTFEYFYDIISETRSQERNFLKRLFR